jgi:hypothetical protein
LTLGRIFKALTGTGLVAGALVAAMMTAEGASGTTTENLTIPVAVTLSGLAASYSATGPGGSATVIANGPLTIQTNNATGYTLNVKATASTFAGGASGSFPINLDTVSIAACVGSNLCQTGPLALTDFLLMRNTSATAGDTFTVNHSVTPPATQAPGTYSASVMYTASANP